MLFEVETGVGSATATSYISVDTADDLLTLNPAWPQPVSPTDPDYDAGTEAAKLVQKQQALMRATQGIDLMYGENFRGKTQNTTQNLCWPRTFRTLGAVPQRLKQATAEFAADIYNGAEAIRELNAQSQVIERSIQGAGFGKTEKYTDTPVSEYRTGMLKIEMFLQPLVNELDNNYYPAFLGT